MVRLNHKGLENNMYPVTSSPYSNPHYGEVNRKGLENKMYPVTSSPYSNPHDGEVKSQGAGK